MPAGHAAAVPWPDRENLAERPLGQRESGQGQESAEEADGQNGHAGPGRGQGERPGGGAGRAGPASGADRTRVIRPATPPRGPDRAPAPPADSPAEPGDATHYGPPPPPPLPHLDPVAKGACTALFGGPAYLVRAS